MAGPGIPSRPGEAGPGLELVHCPRTMGGTMGAGGGLYPLSLGQRRPGFVLDCPGQWDGQSRGWGEAAANSPSLSQRFLLANVGLVSYSDYFLSCLSVFTTVKSL